MIYQVDSGGDNNSKSPLGGVIAQGSNALSMMATIANPITFYGSWGAVVNQAGHSGDLYNYYWTSYSRSTDGRFLNPNNEPSWHNAYLDGYIPLRAKSIYDPCPYLYRIPSNGTWNQFTFTTVWTYNSYLGGVSWNINTLEESWLPSLGLRYASSVFGENGRLGLYYSSTASGQTSAYMSTFNAGQGVYLNRTDKVRSTGLSVRCIEGSLRSAFFSTVVDNNALGVRPILFCRKKYAKTPNTFSSATALESVLDYKELACARVICYRLCLCFAYSSNVILKQVQDDRVGSK